MDALKTCKMKFKNQYFSLSEYYNLDVPLNIHLIGFWESGKV